MVSKSNILFHILIVFLAGCVTKESEALLIVTPSGEECDDYNVIWDVDSVISGDKYLNKKSVYLLNSKREYFDEEENTMFLLKGVFIQKQIKEDFTDCGEVFPFIDESMKIWLYPSDSIKRLRE